MRGWSRPFDDPIPLPGGGQFVTLRDAANYITKLPKAKHDAQEWQAAIEALILVAEHGGPIAYEKIGMSANAVFKGNALWLLKRYQESISAYDKATSINPNLAEAWFGRGNA